MKQKKLIMLLLILLPLVFLCACGKEDKAPSEETGYSVSLQTSVGTGYYWDCTVSDSSIVSVKSTQQLGNAVTPGSTYMTDFLFTGKKRGTATATLCCCQSWDNSVCYLYTCDLTVDRDKTVTGELSSQTARIHPGDGMFKLTASDTSVALWTGGDDGSYTFTPLRDGTTTLTFTSLDASVAPSRIFYLSVSDGGLITITEDTGLKIAETYESLDRLEQKVGFTMEMPAEYDINEISSVGGLAYTNFLWHDVEFAYVGGSLDLDAFLSPGANVMAVYGHKVITQTLLCTMAAWETDGNVFCITSEEVISSEDLLQLLQEILDAQQTSAK